MKKSFCTKVLVPVMALVLVSTAGCVGEVGVEGEAGGVYYGPGYNEGPWFQDGVWVRGQRWDHQHENREVHAPPRGDGGPHLPNRSRDHAPSGGPGRSSPGPGRPAGPDRR